MGYPTSPARQSGGIARMLAQCLGMLAIPFIGAAVIYAGVYATEFGRAVMNADMWDTYGDAQLMVYAPLLLFPAYAMFLILTWRWIFD